MVEYQEQGQVNIKISQLYSHMQVFLCMCWVNTLISATITHNLHVVWPCLVCPQEGAGEGWGWLSGSGTSQLHAYFLC